MTLAKDKDPLAFFGEWYAEAGQIEAYDHTAVALATVDTDGMPSVRMVLLKGWGEDGFVFYSNMDSNKGQDIVGNPKAALCFHWKKLARQVRIRGDVVPVGKAEADAYSPHAIGAAALVRGHQSSHARWKAALHWKKKLQNIWRGLVSA